MATGMGIERGAQFVISDRDVTCCKQRDQCQGYNSASPHGFNSDDEKHIFEFAGALCAESRSVDPEYIIVLGYLTIRIDCKDTHHNHSVSTIENTVWNIAPYLT